MPINKFTLENASSPSKFEHLLPFGQFHRKRNRWVVGSPHVPRVLLSVSSFGFTNFETIISCKLQTKLCAWNQNCIHGNWLHASSMVPHINDVHAEHALHVNSVFSFSLFWSLTERMVNYESICSNHLRCAPNFENGEKKFSATHHAHNKLGNFNVAIND